MKFNKETCNFVSSSWQITTISFPTEQKSMVVWSWPVDSNFWAGKHEIWWLKTVICVSCWYSCHVRPVSFWMQMKSLIVCLQELLLKQNAVDWDSYGRTLLPLIQMNFSFRENQFLRLNNFWKFRKKFCRNFYILWIFGDLSEKVSKVEW